MHQYDEHYFARHALDASNDFEWNDPCVGDYDYGDDDDPSLTFDDDIFPENDDEPIEGDFLGEEE